MFRESAKFDTSGDLKADGPYIGRRKRRNREEHTSCCWRRNDLPLCAIPGFNQSAGGEGSAIKKIADGKSFSRFDSYSVERISQSSHIGTWDHRPGSTVEMIDQGLGDIGIAVGSKIPYCPNVSGGIGGDTVQNVIRRANIRTGDLGPDVAGLARAHQCQHQDDNGDM